ncbi:MAG TPA: hypothetical protein VGM33_07000 [Baekduia sp.]
MSATLSSDRPPLTGLYGSAYLAACARHEAVRPASLAAGGVRLPVLVADGDGAIATPYGYPQPEGDGPLEPLRDAALTCSRPWRAALAPIGRGAELAVLLAERLTPAASRPIAVHDLDGGAPADRFSSGARSMVRRAGRAGPRLERGAVTGVFGTLYRTAMDVLDADPLYRFGDDYFAALNAAGGVQLLLHDEHGVAAGAVFLIGAPEASYHLSARRPDPPPPPGAANLLIAEGLELCRDAGAAVCYLGGGTSTAADDPLLAFKRAMATRVVDRPVFAGSGAGAA